MHPYPYIPTPYYPPIWYTTKCGSGGYAQSVGDNQNGVIGTTSSGTSYLMSNSNHIPGAVNCSGTMDSFSVNNLLVSSATASSTQINDVGITVPGSVSSQKFSLVEGFEVEEDKHVIVLRLVGTTETGDQYVAPVTVKSKPVCSSCGKHNKATAKFCSECGTGLVIV